MLLELNQRIIANANDQEQWHKIRSRSVTASDAARLATSNSIQGVYAQKKQGPFDFSHNLNIQWGVEREPVILKQLGYTQNRNSYHAIGERGFIATPDSLIFDGGALAVCEVKTTVEDFSDRMNKNYLRQMQWQMYVTNTQKCLFVWELRNRQFEVIRPVQYRWIHRDEKAIDQLKIYAQALLSMLK